MGNKEIKILIGYEPYDFMDKETGERRQGITAYFMGDLKLTGYEMSKINLDFEMMPRLKGGPAIYELTYKTEMKKKRIVTSISDIVYIKDVEMMNDIISSELKQVSEKIA